MIMFLEILALSVAVSSVRGYPTGAPAIACENMTPQHGVPAQNTTAPYHISITKGTDHTGTTVYNGKITIIDGQSYNLVKGKILHLNVDVL